MDDTSHPAGDGLMGSGRVVALLSAETPMPVRADRAMALVFIELPGTPCGALLGFTSGAAVRFTEQLRAGFDALCDEPTVIDTPALASLPTGLAAHPGTTYTPSVPADEQGRRCSRR